MVWTSAGIHREESGHDALSIIDAEKQARFGWVIRGRRGACLLLVFVLVVAVLLPILDPSRSTVICEVGAHVLEVLEVVSMLLSRSRCSDLRILHSVCQEKIGHKAQNSTYCLRQLRRFLGGTLAHRLLTWQFCRGPVCRELVRTAHTPELKLSSLVADVREGLQQSLARVSMHRKVGYT